jgi:hypothetical protein
MLLVERRNEPVNFRKSHIITLRDKDTVRIVSFRATEACRQSLGIVCKSRPVACGAS